MAITYVGKATTDWTATSDPSGTNTVSVSISGATIDDDIVIIVFNAPAPAHGESLKVGEETSGGVPTQYLYSGRNSYLRINSDDFEELTSYANFINGMHVFTKHWETGDGTSFDFEIGPYFEDNEIDPNGFVGRIGRFVALSYRNVDTNSIVETYLRWWNDLSHTFELTTSKDDCMLLSIVASGSRSATSGATAPVVTNDASFTNREAHTFTETQMEAKRYFPPRLGNSAPDTDDYYYNQDLDIADFLTTTKGTFSIDYSATGESPIAIVLSLIETSAQSTDPKPTGSSPAITGRGYIEWEEDITNPLEVELWKVNDAGNLAVTTSDNDPVCTRGVFNFDGIGNCLEGEAYFTQPIVFAPFEAVLRLKLSSSNLDPSEYWYTGLISNVEKVNRSLWRTDLVGLFELNRYDKIGASPTFPTLTGIYPNKLNLFEGNVIPVTANTADEWQSWQVYLERKFDLWPDINFGVGTDLKYCQGRPRDGNPVNVSYTANKRRIHLKAERYSIPDYATSWFFDTGTTLTASDYGDRTDASALTPKRVTTTTKDGAGNLILPVGGQIPFYLERSNILTFQALVKPPIKVNNIPDAGGQLAVASRVTITSGSGSAARVVSEVMTGALPYEDSLL